MSFNTRSKTPRSQSPNMTSVDNATLLDNASTLHAAVSSPRTSTVTTTPETADPATDPTDSTNLDPIRQLNSRFDELLTRLDTLSVLPHRLDVLQVDISALNKSVQVLPTVADLGPMSCLKATWFLKGPSKYMVGSE